MPSMEAAQRSTLQAMAWLMQSPEPKELVERARQGHLDTVKRVARASHAKRQELAKYQGQEAAKHQAAASPSLADLAHGPFYNVVAFLDVPALCRLDAACRLARDLNRAHRGPWCALGQSAYVGLELDGESVFYPEGTGAEAKRRLMRVDWKCRYARFGSEVRNFRAPFAGSRITSVAQADDIAYWRCKMRSDLLTDSAARGVYLEVEVDANPDNVSLALVDFEAGGCSSVTFSPDTGAVIRERKVRESPRKVEGTYIQPLPTITSGQGFRGSMGLYLRGGHLAFFRRHVTVNADAEVTEVGAWETTGFVTDLSWAEGHRLSPCLAFRDTGAYHIRLACIGAQPPLVPKAYQDAQWRSLDWDAGEPDMPEN